MNRIDRRAALRVALATALAPTVVSRASAAAVPAQGLINPPGGPMRYLRRVERILAGGASIAVTREFAVSFRRFADGFMLQGSQISVKAVVPAGLGSFARLEESRVEEGLFPVSLDPFGRITSTEAEMHVQTVVGRAFAEAEEQIASQPIAAEERDELRAFVRAIHNAGAMLTAQMPVDLFAPSVPGRSEEQAISLPTGERGVVFSRFEAVRDGTTGLMRTASREILTEIGGDRRRIGEAWRLMPA